MPLPFADLRPTTIEWLLCDLCDLEKTEAYHDLQRKLFAQLICLVGENTARAQFPHFNSCEVTRIDDRIVITGEL